MGFESFPNLQAREIKINQEFDIAKALERPESVFTEMEAHQNVKEAGLATYEKIIMNNESFLGSGNAGIVFKESEKTCLKCVWESLMVGIKNQRFTLLPAKAQKLKRISDYFDEIKQKRRRLATSGFQFESDNSPLKEAGFQVAARKILEKHGLERMIPKLQGVLEFENEEDGKVQDLPYYIHEKVLMVAMERVNGVSIEDLILNYPDNSEVLEKIDLEAFEQKLRKAIDLLHAEELAHKDMSIRNVMVDIESGDPRIIDFGKGKKTDSSEDFEEENRLVGNVVSHLRKFKSDPQGKKDSLSRAFQKFEEKF